MTRPFDGPTLQLRVYHEGLRPYQLKCKQTAYLVIEEKMYFCDCTVYIRNTVILIKCAGNDYVTGLKDLVSSKSLIMPISFSDSISSN